jgi:hypothetical protein
MNSHALLPVVRIFKEARFLRPGINVGVAIYEDQIVLFKPPGKCRSLPEDIYGRNGISALAHAPGVRIKKVLPLDSIESVEVARKGKKLYFTVVSPAGNGEWVLPVAESGCVIEALHLLLGREGKCDFDPSRDLMPRPPRIAGTVVATLLAVIGAGTLAWLWPRAGQDEMAQGLFALTGSILLPVTIFACGYLLHKLSDARLQRRVGVEPFRSRAWSIAFWLAGVTILLLQYLYPSYLLQWMFAHGQTGYLSNPRLDGALTGGVEGAKGGAMATICGATSLICLYLAYRLKPGGAVRKMRQDPRAPILFLRSFGDDGRHNLNPKSWAGAFLGTRPFPYLERWGPFANSAPARLWKLVAGIAVDNAEEQMASFFRKIGPFVGIGRPGETLAQGGAERLYVAHSDWQSQVLQLLDRSAAVILQPAETAGVWWEIEQTMQRVSPPRLLLSLACYQETQEGWDRFRMRFEQLIGKPLPRSRGDALFIHFAGDWTPMLLRPSYRTPFAWPLFGLALDLPRTLAPFLGNLELSVPLPPRRAAPRLPSKAAEVLAALLWNAALLFVLAWCGGMSAHRRVLHDALLGPMKEWKGTVIPYKWRLGSAWTKDFENAFSRPVARFGTDKHMVVAMVQSLGAPGDEPEKLLTIVARAEARDADHGAPIVRQEWITRGTHRWLEAELRSEIGVKRALILVRCYSGPEGHIALTAVNDVAFQPFVGSTRKVLGAILDGFELED